MCIIRFGGESNEYLALTICGRNRPDAVDFWDGNWLWCTVEVSAGGFRGSADGVLRSEDFVRFLPRLERLYQRLDGVALFDTLDGWLDLQFIGDGRGHIEVRGQLCDRPMDGNTLEFRLAIDQTFLPPLIRQVRATVGAFPIIGEIPSNQQSIDH